LTPLLSRTPLFPYNDALPISFDLRAVQPLEQLDLSGVVHRVAGNSEHEVETLGFGKPGQRASRSKFRNKSCELRLLLFHGCVNLRPSEPLRSRQREPILAFEHEGFGCRSGELSAHRTRTKRVMERHFRKVMPLWRRPPESDLGRNVAERCLQVRSVPRSGTVCFIENARQQTRFCSSTGCCFATAHRRASLGEGF